MIKNLWDRWLARLTKAAHLPLPRKQAPRRRQYLLRVEQLEDRAVPAVFLGVAAGDANNHGVILWTRANDPTISDPRAQGVTLDVTVSKDPNFATGNITQFAGVTDWTHDYTLKFSATGLDANTRYYYRFEIAATHETSITGTFKTAPDSTAVAPLHFAFSGDNDGLMRPYALASVIPSENLDFYINLGDVIYENASNLTTSGAHNGQPWLNSPSVTLSNDSLSFNGIPRAFIPGGNPFATQAQLQADYEKKYRENFLPVNNGGQNSLQVLYAAQSNFTTWDNHELGNRKYIDGGAPAGGSVGGPNGTDMPTGRGVDARNNGGVNPNDAADLLSATDLASLGGFMNKSTGFQTLENVFLEYQPIADRGAINAPNDPRTDGTRQLYSATQWGQNAIYVNTDSRSYRDIRLKTATANADDTGARADNPDRTYLGDTQLAWLKQTLLDSQKNGTTWKFVSISDPIDELGPIGGALTGTLTPVNADGGKSYMGGYRAERNDLLKFIADNHITNVVFLSTDDHQNRINELFYSPTGQTNLQSSYVQVPYCFSIVCGPLGATGPDTITNHSFSNIKAIADSLANAQVAAGIDPIGLQNYPGLHDLIREGDSTAGTSPQPVDFYSPDTFNYTVLDVSKDGRTLTVKSVGMNATAPNAGIEYVDGPAARTIFSFQIDALPVSFNSFQTEARISKSKFEMKSIFTLGDNSNGINPMTDTLKFQIDSLSVTIPPGSFTKNSRGAYEFAGTIGNFRLDATIRTLSDGRFLFQVVGWGKNLPKVPRGPLPVSLTIGVDGGTGTTLDNLDDLLDHGKGK